MLHKILFQIILFGTIAFATTLKVGDTIEPFDLKDQFDKTTQVNSKDYKTIIVAFEKDTAAWVNEYLKDKSESYLKDNSALFISDINGMPYIITKMFALPKMRKYNYSLLLIYDEIDTFPSQEEKLTVLKIQNDKIVDISFITDKEVSSIFNQN